MKTSCYSGQPTLHSVARFGNTDVYTVHDDHVEPGHEWLLFHPCGPAHDDEARGLAYVFCPDLMQITYFYSEPGFPSGYRIPHDHVVDARLRQIIDIAAAIRDQAPRLVQLNLFAGALGEHWSQA